MRMDDEAFAGFVRSTGIATATTVRARRPAPLPAVERD
jgi:hypothetical protein